MFIARRLPWIASLFIGLLFPALHQAEAWVFHVDDRVPSQFRSIGLLEADLPEGQAQGTAFLVDGCGILTNFHVVFGPWTVTVLRPPSHRFESRFTLTEVTLPDGSHPTARAHPVAWGNYLGPERQLRRADQDWTYLVLDDCLGETYGYLELQSGGRALETDFDYRYTAVGYSSGRQKQDPDCRLSAGDDTARRKAMGHDCVMLAGDSGGPILKQGTNRVVAVGSGYLVADGRLQCATGSTGLAQRFTAPCSNIAVGISADMAQEISDARSAGRVQLYLAALGYEAGARGDIRGAEFKAALAEFRRAYRVPASFNGCQLEAILRMRIVGA